jgi:non-ribosomal peptide synthetase component F
MQEGLLFHSLYSPDPQVYFDLIVSMEETMGGLAGSSGYSSDLFDELTISRIVKRFENLLSDIADNPDKRLSSLNLHL